MVKKQQLVSCQYYQYLHAKIIFHFDGAGTAGKGKYSCLLTLLNKSKMPDQKQITIDVVDSADKYSSTFISNIDGSVQYYTVTPSCLLQQKAPHYFYQYTERELKQ